MAIQQWQIDMEVKNHPKNSATPSPYAGQETGAKKSSTPPQSKQGNFSDIGHNSQSSASKASMFDPRGGMHSQEQFKQYGKAPTSASLKPYLPFVEEISSNLGDVATIIEKAKMQSTLIGPQSEAGQVFRGLDTQPKAGFKEAKLNETKPPKELMKDNYDRGDIDFGKLRGLAQDKEAYTLKEGQPKRFDNYIAPTTPIGMDKPFTPDSIKQPWKMMPTEVEGDIAGRKNFMDNLAPVAARIGIEAGIDPDTFIALVALETQYGEKIPARGVSYNLGGVHWHPTKGYVNAIEARTNAPRPYVQYDSWEDSLWDMANRVLQLPYYENFVNAKGWEDATHAIGHSKYHGYDPNNPAHKPHLDAYRDNLRDIIILNDLEYGSMTPYHNEGNIAVTPGVWQYENIY